MNANSTTMTTRRAILAGGAGLLIAVLSGGAQAEDGFTVVAARKAPLGLLEDGTGYAEAWLLADGPGSAIIRAKQGVETKLRFVNALDHDIWLHFFGVRGPSDFMTFQVAVGGEPTEIMFTPPDAGTFWIGPMAEVSQNRDRGLYAVLIVEEAEPPAGIVDLPLIVDDWIIDETGAITGEFGDVEAMVGEGRLGNWFTVNNRFRPSLKREAGVYTRLRVLNAANIRVMGLQFKGQEPLLIAFDGQPVKPRPLGQKPLFLAPGQRADMLLAPDQGDVVLALDLFEDVVEIAYFNATGDAPPPAIGDNFALPPNPAALPPIEGPERVVKITLEGGIKGGLSHAQFKGQMLDLRALLENGKGWAINGVAGPAPEPLFTVEQGEKVGLHIRNATAFAQVLHLHGHVWELPASDGERGPLSDTVVIPAAETVKLAFLADNPGAWALHSLQAERFDGGMVAGFVVTPKPAAEVPPGG